MFLLSVVALSLRRPRLGVFLGPNFRLVFSLRFRSQPSPTFRVCLVLVSGPTLVPLSVSFLVLVSAFTLVLVPFPPQSGTPGPNLGF